MRLDTQGRIARDFEGRAVATILNGRAFFQQPVDPADRDGAWEMALRSLDTTGRGARFAGASSGASSGASFWASRGSTWIAQNDALNPRLFGTPDWLTDLPNGRVGDVDVDGAVLVNSDDGRTLYVDGQAIARGPSQGGTRLIDGLLCYTNGGQVMVYDVDSGVFLDAVEQVGPGASWAIAFSYKGPGSEVEWIAYQTDAEGGVLHRLDDASQGYRYGTPQSIYDPEPHWNPDGSFTLHWSTDPGSFWQSALTIPVLGEGMEPLTTAPVLTPIPGSVGVAGTFFPDATTPGNVSVWLSREDDPQTPRGPMHPTSAILATPGIADQVPANRLLGLYVSRTPTISLGEQIVLSRPVAERLRVPLFVYDDQRDYRYDLINGWCDTTPWVACPQWYLNLGEDPAAFAAGRWASISGWKAPVCPAVACYTRGGTVAPDAMGAALNALTAIMPNILGFLLFAWDRRDGVTGVPALRPWATLWLSTPARIVPADARLWAAAFFPEVPVIPDFSADIQALFDTGEFDLSSKDGCGIFTDAVVRLLQAKDPRVGHLLKKPGQNQYNGHAVDNLLYLQDAPALSVAVDFIRASGTPEATLTWQPDIPRYTAEDWRPAAPQPVGVKRPALPLMLGMTAFDWGTTLRQDWLALHDQYALPVLRLVPQTRFRTPRTMEEGRLQLEAALIRLQEQGRKALVCINNDTAEYGLTRDEVRANTNAINSIMRRRRSAVAAATLGNELANWNEQPFMIDPFFLRELDLLVDADIPLAWGSVTDRVVSPTAAGGSWIAHHADRGESPEVNGVIMADGQATFGKPVVNEEDLGFAEPGTAGQRTWDVGWITRVGQQVKQLGLGGIIYHTEAGLSADPTKFGPSHRAGAMALVSALGSSTPTEDPVLDRPLTLGSPSAYAAFLTWHVAVNQAIIDWKRKATGSGPNATDLAHIWYRIEHEGGRWKTLRGALEDQWKGGGA